MTDEEWDEHFQRMYSRLVSYGGYFSIADAVERGFTPELRAESIARGVCAEVDDAVMRLTMIEQAPPREERWFCAWLRCGNNRVLMSHTTALALHGLAHDTEKVHVTISMTRDLPDVVPDYLEIHRGDVDPPNAHIGSFNVTTLERTLRECAEMGVSPSIEPAPKTSGIEQLPPPASTPHFADPNLALAVLEALHHSGVLVLPRLEVADEYELDEELYARLTAYPFTAEQLASIERLAWSGGGMHMEHVVWPQWDGETEEFDIHTLAGIERLPNLRELQLDPQMPVPEEELVALRGRGITITRGY
ncbi:MAG TPA: hypothetical protein VGM90_30210 [Kofleriaceae bacterium]